MNFTLTGRGIFFIVISMKWLAVITLAAVSFTVLAPTSLPFMVTSDGTERIGALDVCHSTVPVVSSNEEMPCINSVPAACSPMCLVALTDSQKPFFLLSLFTFDSEQPPKA